MLNAFAKNIADKKLFAPGDSLLLAISGGVDSVVLAHLLKRYGAPFHMAHCNFKLRGADSDADETFCTELAKQLNVPLYTKTFDIKSYCLKHKVSVQMAARELRYDWFSSLLPEHGLTYLLTAHHANDSIETVFINLLRGTGINGLKGIPERTETVLRPLLPFTKEEIKRFAVEQKIAYRTDESNAEEKYERNFLRLNLIPALKKINPAAEEVLINNIRNFNEEAAMVHEFLNGRVKGLVTRKGSYILLDKHALKKDPYLHSVLHFVLTPLGFNSAQAEDIRGNICENGLTGKVIYSNTHVLAIEREQLILKPLSEGRPEQFTAHSLDRLTEHPQLVLKKIQEFALPLSNEIVLDADRLIFPLTIRPSVRGDKFRPFGMKGFRLLSDFFKDEKLNTFEKENCRLLVNGNGEIIWVMGHRSDDRYKVTPKEKNLIKLTFID